MCRIKKWCFCVPIDAVPIVALVLTGIIAFWVLIKLIWFGIVALIRENNKENSEEKYKAVGELYALIIVSLIELILAITTGVCLSIAFLKKNHFKLIIVWLVWAIFYIVVAIVNEMRRGSIAFFLKPWLFSWMVLWLILVALLIYVWIGILNFYWNVSEGAYRT